jgi:hypothetical protein
MSTVEFHRNVEATARRIERMGRTISRVGREISQAISLPLIGAGFAVFHALLADSARHFGPLFQAFDQLKGAVRGVLLAVGNELQPVFLQVISLLRSGIATLRGWITAFHQLPVGVRQAVIYTLAFLAALGPTVFVIGKVITAVGALIKILPLLATSAGLATLAVTALAGAALYTATHWDWAKLKLTLAWTWIVDKFFEGVRLSLTALDVFTLGITKFAGVTDFLRGKVDALSDRALGNLGATILALEANLQKGRKGLSDLGDVGLTAQQIMQQLNDALAINAQRMQILGPRYNFAAANAQALETAVNALTAAHIPLNAILDRQGMTLADLAAQLLATREAAEQYARVIATFGPLSEQAAAAFKHWQDMLERGKGFETATRQMERSAKMIRDINEALVQAARDSLAALGEQLGNILAGVAHGFRGLGRLLLGVVGAMLKTIGQALIAFGIAGDAIRKFITNPLAAIAAGVALIALGTALASAAGNAVSAGGAALAGGGGGASSSVGTGGGGGGESVLILELRGDAVITTLFQDPRNQDALAEALSDLSGRRVRVEPRSVA